MKLIKNLVVLFLLLLSAGGLQAQLLDKSILTLEAAEKVAAGAEAEAKKRNATVVIVVVDDGGYPLVLKRLDNTQVASVDVGIGKARTAAIFRRPSRDFEDQIRNGRVASLVLPGATPLQGGLPLVFDNRVVGAIGVSGNTPQEEEAIASAGAKAFPVTIFSPNSDAPKNVEPEEIRGKDVQGGEIRQIAEGDVVVMTGAAGDVAIDGIKLDQRGNLYVSGPGGVWIISAAGKPLGTIVVPKQPHNFAWGGGDGKTLYMTAEGTLYRMPLNIPGIRPGGENHKLAPQH